MNAVEKPNSILTLLFAICIAAFPKISAGQDVPSDYQEVMKVVGKQSDYVHRVDEGAARQSGPPFLRNIGRKGAIR